MAEKSWKGGKAGEFLIPGFHAVREALLRGSVPFKEVRLSAARPSPRMIEIRNLASRRGIPVVEKPPAYFADCFPGLAHQGIAAVAPGFAYADLDKTARDALDAPGGGLLVALDHVTDEGNLGALIRTAAFFGAHGLVLPKDRAAGVSPRVFKRSSGACSLVPLAQVVNLARSMLELKKMGFWMVGAAGESRLSVYDFDWRRPTVVVLGSEEKGLSPGVRKCCDALVAIPGSGLMASLNVSVAGGVILGEIRRQRGSA